MRVFFTHITNQNSQSCIFTFSTIFLTLSLTLNRAPFYFFRLFRYCRVFDIIDLVSEFRKKERSNDMYKDEYTYDFLDTRLLLNMSFS